MLVKIILIHASRKPIGHRKNQAKKRDVTGRIQMRWLD